MVKHLILQRGEEAFRDRVIPTHAGSAHRLPKLILLAIGLEFLRRILRTMVRMKYRPASGVTVEAGHLECVDDEAGAHMGGHLPAHDHPGGEIEHDREVDPALTPYAGR